MTLLARIRDWFWGVLDGWRISREVRRRRRMWKP